MPKPDRIDSDAFRYEVVNVETGAVDGTPFLCREAAAVKVSFLNGGTRVLHVVRAAGDSDA